MVFVSLKKARVCKVTFCVGLRGSKCANSHRECCARGWMGESCLSIWKGFSACCPGVRQALQLVSLGARIRALDVSCLCTRGQSHARSSGGETAQFCDPLQTVPRVCVCLHMSTPVCVRGGVLDSRMQVCVLGLRTPVYPSGLCTSFRLRTGSDLRSPSLDETRARAPPALGGERPVHRPFQLGVGAQPSKGV